MNAPVLIKKKSRKKWWIIGGIVLLIIIVGNLNSPASKTSASESPTTTSKAATTTTTQAPTTTIAHAQVVSAYEASAKAVTVSQLADDPAAYTGETLVFKGTIATFVTDSTGNTGAMNVAGLNDPTSLVYVQLDPLVDVTQMAKGDTVEIWGSGQGSITGQNDFGGTIHEAAVIENYLTDITSGYVDNLVSNPQ